jgi:hypothetical protein
MSNILDDVFQWAGQQPQDNTVSVKIAIATNETQRSNLVSYAEGTLTYHAPHVGRFLLPPYFSSSRDGIEQYYSDRRYAGQHATHLCPFACDQSDPLEVAIHRPASFAGGGNYSVSLKSSKYGFDLKFDPSFDDATGVLYGVIGATFITVSLCDRQSLPPVR